MAATTIILKEFFITIDCGNTTLGICSGVFETPKEKIIRNDDLIDYTTVNISNFDFGIYDLTNNLGMDVRVADRFRELKKVLDNINVPVHCVPRLYVERQMGINFYSNQVFSASAMYFINKFPNLDVLIVGPSLKNTIAFDPSLRLQVFLAAKNSVDAANKAHTAENLRFFCQKYNHNISIIPKGKHEHIGDAFMQLIAIATTPKAYEYALNPKANADLEQPNRKQLLGRKSKK